MKIFTKSLFSIVFVIYLISNLQTAHSESFEPLDGKVYHGVQTMTFESGSDPLAGYFSVIKDANIQPAVRGFFFSIPGERGPANTLKGLGNFFHIADSVGFMPELSLFFVKNTATDSVIAASDEYDWILDSIITLSKDYGKRMFLRIGGEFNGAGPGWNGGGYHPYYYVTMFRKIVDMFAARGLRDSIAVNWCYEPAAANDFDSVDAKGARWYPGDEYVDWFGLDVFHPSDFDQSLPDSTGRSITKKGKSERFLAMAREKKKPVYMSETSAQGINISSDSTDGVNDWNNWFAKFFEFINVHTEIKGFGYIDANWPEGAYPDWGDARIQNSPYVTNKYIAEMRLTKYIHLHQVVTFKDSIKPLDELGAGYYKSYQGGFYPDGNNTMPELHLDAGKFIASEIKPLNTNGDVDNTNGKIVLLSIGMSNCTQEYSVFKQLADTLSEKNPKLVVVDGAQGGQTAAKIQDPVANFWTVVEQRLTAANVSLNQVQAIWYKEADMGPKNDFPVHAQTLATETKKICRILKDKYPNVKLCYLSNRTYGGYAITGLNPEPMAYESGFSVKWVIESQINGDTALIFTGDNPNSPWLAWGPYLWGNGLTPRNDGLTWLKQDFVPSDYTHPSDKGRLKVANLLLNFFKNDETTKPWFLKNSGTGIQEINDDIQISIIPNPASEYIEISIPSNYTLKGVVDEDIYDISIYNILGECVLNYATPSPLGEVQGVRLDVSRLPMGMYFFRIGNQSKLFVRY